MMNSTRHPAFTVPTKPHAVTVERRQAFLLRSLWAWCFDTDLDTLEKVLIILKLVLSVAVLVLDSRLIATPPPPIQGYVLTLPAPLWFALLVSTAAWHVRARARIDFYQRRNAMLCAGLLCGGLCGSLWLRAPTVLILVLPGVFGQMLVAARLSCICKRGL
jgi:hypothetical protein